MNKINTTLIKKILDWLFLTKDGQYVAGQRPNWQITAAFSLWALSTIIEAQPYNNLLVILYRLFLMYWASLEIKTGVNHFRNILGIIVFAVILSGFLNQLL